MIKRALKKLISIIMIVVLVIGICSTPTIAALNNLITNGGFESGFNGWTVSGDFHADPGFPYYHSGTRYSYLSTASGMPGNNLVGYMYQTINIPSSATSASLTFWYNISTNEIESSPYDVLNVTIQNSSGTYLSTVGVWSNVHSQGAGNYAQASYNLSPYIGQTIRVHFLATTDASRPTVFRIDDVEVNVNIPDPTYPDLAVSSVSAPTSGTSGSSISVSWNVVNSGSAPSGLFNNRISLATTPYGTDISLGNYIMSSIPASSTSSSTQTVQIPESVTPGYYYVTVYADSFNSVSESNEGNNINKAPNQINVTNPPTYVTLTLYVHEDSISGPVISGAQVTGQDGVGTPFSQVTSTSGYVTITGIPGTWYFSVTKSGYQTNSWSQSITTTGTKHAFLLTQQVTPPTVPPTLIAPSAGATGVSISPTFQWGQVDGATYYGLYISEPPYGPDHLVFDSELDYGPISGTSLILPINLDQNMTYYWNMRAGNNAGWGPFSPSRSFTTMSSTTLTAYIQGRLSPEQEWVHWETLCTDESEITIQLIGSESQNMSNVPIVEYEWYVNNGLVSWGGGHYIQFTFSGAAYYDITLMVYDADGNSASETLRIEVRGGLQYNSSDFFKFNPGYGMKYHVGDNGYPLDVNVWATSQYVETKKPHDLDFVFTLVKEGTEGQYYRNSSIGGQIDREINGRDITCLYAGYPVGNQANFYFNFSLPTSFTSGDQWNTLDNKTYQVEYVGSETIGSIVFDHCIKVSIDDSQNDDEYLRGTGYFILAKDVGIVKIVFNRSNGSIVFYEYITHTQFSQHTLSGVVRYQDIPVEGIAVQIANADWGTKSITDSNGNFSVQAYGSDLVLRVGYDQDDDRVFDFNLWEPEEYIINNISSDQSGLVINLQKEPLPTPTIFYGFDYFITTPGHTIKYGVTDSSNLLDTYVWIAFQNTMSGNPLGFDFALTVMREGTEGGNFGDGALAGYTSREVEGKDLIWISSGNTGIHSHRLQYFSLPLSFSSGDEWTIPDLGGPQGLQTYRVDYLGTQTVGGVVFDDTIRVEIDDTQAEVEYLRGTGYFILAKGLGVVKFEFNRTDGSTLKYEYITDTQLPLHTLSGSVLYSGTPVQGIVVDLSSISWGAGCLTDEQGAFSLQCYGPDMLLRIGYDLDLNGIFDFDVWSPERYMVNDITSDIYDIQIELQKSPIGENNPPEADAASLTGQPDIMYPNTQYTVTAAYHDLDGKEDLKYCYLRLNHPEKPLTMMWNQETEEFGVWAGEEGENYLTVTGYVIEMIPTGYEINWTFEINETWAEAGGINFGVLAMDDSDVGSGWDFDDSVATFSCGIFAEFRIMPDSFDPVFDQILIFDASESRPSVGASIVSYLWEFGESPFTEFGSGEIVEHTYSARQLLDGEFEKSFELKLTVTDELGNSAMKTRIITVKRPPVLLVHGLRSIAIQNLPLVNLFFDPPEATDENWKDLVLYITGKHIDDPNHWDPIFHSHLSDDGGYHSIKRIANQGYVVYISDYTFGSPESPLDIRLYAARLAIEIDTIKENENVSKVDIVAHSMGGLVSRAYIEYGDIKNLQPDQSLVPRSYGNDVRKLIFLGSPNQGAFLADEFVGIADFLSWTSVMQMATQSEFIRQLNEGSNTSGISQKVEYSALAGNYYTIELLGHIEREYLLSSSPYNFKYLIPLRLYRASNDEHDGIVNVSNVRLDEIPNSRWRVASQDHGELRTKADALFWIKGILTESVIDGESIIVPDSFGAYFASPGELRIRDSFGNVTGLINKSVYVEIPHSIYDTQRHSVFIFPSDDSYLCEVFGKNNGFYGLKLIITSGGNITEFVAGGIPIQDGSTHQYSVDWQALSYGQSGVTIQIDADGDGEFERTITSDHELTAEEFAEGEIEPPQPPNGLEVGGVIYSTNRLVKLIPLIALFTIVAISTGIVMKRRRIQR